MLFRSDLQDIMAIGRWGSIAAILYIVGSLERQVSASDRLGKGRLVFDSGSLHRRLGTSLDARDAPVAPVDRWTRYLQEVDGSNDDDED